MAEASGSCYDSEDDADGDEGASDHGTATAAASLDKACGKAAAPPCRVPGPGAGASATVAAGKQLLAAGGGKGKAAAANSSSISRLAGAAAGGGRGAACYVASASSTGFRPLAAAAGAMQAPQQPKNQNVWLNPWLLAVFPGKEIKIQSRVRIPVELCRRSYGIEGFGGEEKELLVQVKMPAKVAKQWGALGSSTEAAEWPGEELMVVQQLTARLRIESNSGSLLGGSKEMKRFLGCRVFCYEVVSLRKLGLAP